jgi:hypothetical protein
MNQDLIPFTLTGEYTLQLAPDAEQQRAELLAQSSQITSIENPLQYAAAQYARDQLAKARISIEKTRESVKAPVIEKGKEIDGIARTFVAPITIDESRLKRLMDSYADEQRRIEQEKITEARRVAAEAERVRIEAERKEREAAEAERRAQLARDNAATLAQSKAAAKVEDAAAKQRAEAEAAETRRVELAAQQSAAATVATRVFVPSGSRVVVDYEIVSLRELYAHNPDLLELAPKRRDILAHLDRLEKAGLPLVVPGLTITKKTTTR